MDPATGLLELLRQFGPQLLFLLAVLETCFVTGLVVPSGVATSFATVLALQGEMGLLAVAVAATAGGGLGDSIGFWVGRLSGQRVLAGRGRFARAAARHHAAARELFGRHPIYSVTLARLISFVRTLMPMAAGMSGISYRRYLPFEIIGLFGWTALYMGIGVLARASWQAATRMVGAGGALVFALLALVAWIGWRRRGRVTTAHVSEPEAGAEQC